MVSTAAQRLKALLPSLSGLPGSVQAELFIVYSTLKNLGVEMEYGEEADGAKRAALRKWLQRLRRLARAHRGDPWARQLGRLVDAGDCPTVAAIMADVAAPGHPEWVVDKIMEWTIAYLSECNEAELSGFRKSARTSGHRAPGA